MAADEMIYSAPSAEQSSLLETAGPSPALQPREVMTTMLHALHRSNFDTPRPRFGAEVAMRFLAPSNPASKVSPQRFADFLGQDWYLPLLNWAEFRWAGEPTLLGDKEFYQQVSVRTSASADWVRVRFILERVPFYATSDQWMVSSVFVEEPDGIDTRGLSSGEGGIELGGVGGETAGDVVMTVMRAVRDLNEPYPLHGCEVAIRYCSPTNRASSLSPQSFAQYLDEPWYRSARTRLHSPT